GSASPYLSLAGSPLTLTSAATGTSFSLSGAHTYAKPGLFTGTVLVSDAGGGSDSKTVNVTIQGPQTITLATIPSHTYGDAPFALSATGGASSQPVSFAVTGDPSVCALSSPTGAGGTGSTTVTVLKVGTCAITASQAGDAVYHPAPSVTQSFSVQPATLTAT